MFQLDSEACDVLNNCHSGAEAIESLVAEGALTVEGGKVRVGGVVDSEGEGIGADVVSGEEHVTAFQQHVESVRANVQVALTRYLEAVRLFQSHGSVPLLLNLFPIPV